MSDVIVSIYKGIADLVRKPFDTSVKIILEDELDEKGKPLTYTYIEGERVVRKRRRKRKEHFV